MTGVQTCALPIFLLTAILIVVGLGAFQRLSVDVETKVGDKDKAEGKTRRA